MPAAQTRHREQNRSHRRRGTARPETLSATEARQGEIILSTPSMRAVFISGLVGAVAIALLLLGYFLIGA